MKKTITIIAIIAIMFTMHANAQRYTMDATVYEVNGNITTFEDSCGYLWDWENEDGESWTVGEEVRVRFYSPTMRGTRLYDEIVKIF